MQRYDYHKDRVRNRAVGYLTYRFYNPGIASASEYWGRRNQFAKELYKEHRAKANGYRDIQCFPFSILTGEEVQEVCRILKKLGAVPELTTKVMEWWSGLVPEPKPYLYLNYNAWPEVWKQ